MKRVSIIALFFFLACAPATRLDYHRRMLKPYRLPFPICNSLDNYYLYYTGIERLPDSTAADRAAETYVKALIHYSKNH